MLSSALTPVLSAQPIVSAQTDASLSAAGQNAGGSGQFLFFGVMIGLLVLMFWFTSRNRRRQQQKMKDQQSKMVPGTQVMTSYGLYGRVVSIDQEAVKAVLEIAPGTQVTVHLQTLTTVVDDQTPGQGGSGSIGATSTENN